MFLNNDAALEYIKESSEGSSKISNLPDASMQDNPATRKLESVDLQEKTESRNTEESGAANKHGILSALSQTISLSSHIDPGPPPDGGLTAWTQAIVGHLVVFNTWGYINSFGVFQTYYVSDLGFPPSNVSWIGSIQIFLLFFIGTFSGRATDYGLFRVTIIIGSFFHLLGIFMTSLSTKYWQLVLAQGICGGLGNGLVFCPSLAVLSTYFTKKRSVAIAIAASGSSTGGLIYPVIVQRLLPKIGFPWTVRIIGFIMLGLQAVYLTLMKTRLPPRKSGPLVEWKAFKDPYYTLFSIGMFLVFWGLYFAIYYIGSFGRDILGVSREDSINNLLILNGVGIVGRIIPAYLADRFYGPLNSLIPAALGASILVYCWAAVSSQHGLTAFSVVYGLFASAIQALFPATLSSMTVDLKKAGVRMGMVFSVVSLATLTGAPLAGALIQNNQGRYLHAQMFAGSVVLCGCLTLLASRVAKTGLKFRAKV